MKYILVLTFLLLFTGCDSSLHTCKTLGWEGFTIQYENTAPYVYCSNGKLTTNGLAYLSSDGTQPIKYYQYYKFK